MAGAEELRWEITAPFCCCCPRRGRMPGGKLLSLWCVSDLIFSIIVLEHPWPFQSQQDLREFSPFGCLDSYTQWNSCTEIVNCAGMARYLQVHLQRNSVWEELALFSLKVPVFIGGQTKVCWRCRPQRPSNCHKSQQTRARLPWALPKTPPRLPLLFTASSLVGDGNLRDAPVWKRC